MKGIWSSCSIMACTTKNNIILIALLPSSPMFYLKKSWIAEKEFQKNGSINMNFRQNSPRVELLLHCWLQNTCLWSLLQSPLGLASSRLQTFIEERNTDLAVSWALQLPLQNSGKPVFRHAGSCGSWTVSSSGCWVTFRVRVASGIAVGGLLPPQSREELILLATEKLAVKALREVLNC